MIHITELVHRIYILWIHNSVYIYMLSILLKLYIYNIYNMYIGKIRQEFNKTSIDNSVTSQRLTLLLATRYMLQNKRFGCKPTTIKYRLITSSRLLLIGA